MNICNKVDIIYITSEKGETVIEEKSIGKIRKLYPITIKKKKMISTKIKGNKNSIFNTNYLIEILPLINSLNEVDLTKLLKMNDEQFKKCIFLENHFCWISSNDDGKQRYFTKGNLTYALDIYDLLTIYFNCNYNRLFTFLMEFGFNDNSWKNKEILKHIKNKKDINQILNKNAKIAFLIEDKIDIYIAINDFGSKNSLAFDKYKSNSIFFISIRHLKEIYKLPYSISTINQMINLYSILGLLYKIPEKEIENPIYNEYLKVKTKKAPISFYAIPSLTNLSLELSLKADILISNNVDYYNLNKELYINLKKSYSTLILNYSDNLGGGNQTKKAKSILNEKDNIEIIFEEYLSSSKIVAKEWVKKNLNYKLSNTAFDKKWKDIIKRHNGISVKATKSIKLKYNLETNQEVFIRNEN